METPLLLNPVRDFPEKHMRIKTEENKLDKGCLQAVELSNGAIDKKGETTIKLLGLNNVVTIKQRQELLELIRERMRRIEKLSAKLDGPAAKTELEELKAEKEEEINKLMDHLEPDEPYLMLARQVILPFMRQQQLRGIEQMIQTLSNLGPGAERDHLKVAMKEQLKKLGAHLAPGQPDLEAARHEILPFMNKLMGKS